jgi:hypothetical protein
MWTLALAALLVVAGPARADDAERIERLEREVESLKAALEQVQAERSGDWMQAASPEPGPFLGPPKLSIQGFADVNYGASWTRPDDGPRESGNRFAVGSMDLLITSQVAESVNVLSETLFKLDEGGHTHIEVERLLLRYEHADWLKLTAGKGHTPIGYWTDVYHHGTWMFTPTTGPLIFTFDHDSGLLPLHFVGAGIDGQLSGEWGVFSYASVVSNGRAEAPHAVQHLEDADDTKAVALRLRFEPSALPGFGVGTSIYHDRIPAIEDEPERAKYMPEQILGLHAFYREDPYELLAEAVGIRHRDRVMDDTLISYGGYLQAAYRIGRFKPYYRFDWIGVDESDPYYEHLHDAEDRRRHTAGLRIDWQTFVSLKLEYRHDAADSGRADGAAAQAAFAF